MSVFAKNLKPRTWRFGLEEVLELGKNGEIVNVWTWLVLGPIAINLGKS